MKISVRTTHYTNDNSPQLRGYATVKFDDSYVLESVKIMERQDSNEIFIALPSLMVRTKDQNGNYVINDKGEYVKEFKEVFHPITAESRKVLNSAIMDSFSKNDGKYTTVEFGNDRFQPTLARIFESSVKDIEGVGSVIFSDSFVLENVQARNGKSGEYFDSPKRKVRNEKKTSGYEYVEFFHPVKAETYNELRDSVVNGLNYTRNMKRMNSYDNSRGQDEVLDMTGESRGLGR